MNLQLSNDAINNFNTIIRPFYLRPGPPLSTQPTWAETNGQDGAATGGSGYKWKQLEWTNNTTGKTVYVMTNPAFYNTTFNMGQDYTQSLGNGPVIYQSVWVNDVCQQMNYVYGGSPGNHYFCSGNNFKVICPPTV